MEMGETVYLSFDDAKRESLEFRRIVGKISILSNKIKSSLALLKFHIPQRRADTPFAEYQLPELKMERAVEKDRVFPLDTVSIQEFRRKTDTEPGGVKIHTGFYADEYARSFNALAITIANDIYFRNGAYNPHSEEGRRTLTHELTHVVQHAEKRITKNVTEKELEEEAEQADKQEIYNPDPNVFVNFGGKNYKLKRSEMKLYASQVADNIVKWLVEQKTELEEEKYLSLLCCVKEWLEECA